AAPLPPPPPGGGPGREVAPPEDRDDGARERCGDGASNGDPGPAARAVLGPQRPHRRRPSQTGRPGENHRGVARRHCEEPAGRRSNPESGALPWIASLSLAMTVQTKSPAERPGFSVLIERCLTRLRPRPEARCRRRAWDRGAGPWRAPPRSP